MQLLTMVNCLIICALMKKTLTMTKLNGLIKSFRGKILYNKIHTVCVFITELWDNSHQRSSEAFSSVISLTLTNENFNKTHNRRLFKFFFNFLDTLKGLSPVCTSIWSFNLDALEHTTLQSGCGHTWRLPSLHCSPSSCRCKLPQ